MAIRRNPSSQRAQRGASRVAGRRSDSARRARRWSREPGAARLATPPRDKVLLVFGTRPEAIKMAPIIHRLQRSGALDVSICVTAQHRELLDQMMDAFGLQADHDLGVMSDNQGLTETFATILNRLAPIVRAERPAAVLVQGDTSSALAGALAAYHARVPVGHVEAGLRTGNAYEPFPEELNRQLVARLATWHYAPTAKAASNLLREGIAAERILVTGNTIVDALHHICERIDCSRANPRSRKANTGERMLLVTAHRRENFGNGIENICAALRSLGDRNPDLRIVYPVHPNPSVDRPVRKLLGSHPQIRLIAPVDYVSFIDLMRRADVILTDSGGIQEEAPSLGVPVLVTRDTTERPEGIEAGVARLVGTDGAAIITHVEQLLRDDTMRARMRRTVSPYGDGRAAERIGEHLEQNLGAGQALRQAEAASGGARR
ncbi:MAG TPA: UDP-N-acetylglucosamine 2-epimerase (non-hydrolyzing) [Terriglobales bacterium]|nr:UDP-N-acetylglucosamine 2-epimerase (non-hydrolyzing) [Terriglobales bacterium]